MSEYGTLTVYATGDPIRPATRDEWLRSLDAGETGAYRDDDGRDVFVAGGYESKADELAPVGETVADILKKFAFHYLIEYVDWAVADTAHIAADPANAAVTRDVWLRRTRAKLAEKDAQWWYDRRPSEQANGRLWWFGLLGGVHAEAIDTEDYDDDFERTARDMASQVADDDYYGPLAGIRPVEFLALVDDDAFETLSAERS